MIYFLDLVDVQVHNTMCSRHDIAEIFPKLKLNTNQSINIFQEESKLSLKGSEKNLKMVTLLQKYNSSMVHKTFFFISKCFSFLFELERNVYGV